MSQSLFSFNQDGCKSLAPWQPFDERQVQVFFERNLHELLRLGMVASEWAPAGEALRMDTLAITAQGNPVIIEFKKVGDSGLLSQILAYKSCLMRHQREFESMVHARWPNVLIDWAVVQLVCIAPIFSRFDIEAIDSIQADLDLISYQFFGQDNVLLNTVKSTRVEKKPPTAPRVKRSFAQQHDVASAEVKNLLCALRAALEAQEDVFQSETRDGVTLSAGGSELGAITLTQGLHPRIKIAMTGNLPDDLATSLGSIRKGKGMTEVTLRKPEEIPSLLTWVEQECRSATMGL